jgi:hypothetical protein
MRSLRRRSCLKVILGSGLATAVSAQPKAKNPILLDLDMQVDPAKEQELIKNFRTQFKPEAMKHPGYINVTVAKLRSALSGTAPAGLIYRFSLTFESEELRQKWIKTPEHARVWPLLENCMVSKNYTTLLFDAI